MPRRCPVCGKEVPEDPRPPSYPFCSPRCGLVDLGDWLAERHAISEDSPNSESAGAGEGEIPK